MKPVVSDICNGWGKTPSYLLAVAFALAHFAAAAALTDGLIAYMPLLMMDGSAIDLSAHSAPWNCRFTLTGTSAYGNIPKVAFNAGATVTIKLGERDLEALSGSGEYVALWATDAVPDSSVKFVIDESNANDFHLKRDNTGLKVRENLGLQVIIR